MHCVLLSYDISINCVCDEFSRIDDDWLTVLSDGSELAIQLLLIRLQNTCYENLDCSKYGVF